MPINKKNLCTAFSVALGALLMPTLAIPHSWYDYQCCSDNDCHPIASCDDLVKLKDGTTAWGEYIFRADMEKPSRDGKCHVCIYNNQPRCFYTSQGS